MQKLYRVFTALIISLSIFTLAFMVFSLDARIGQYEIQKQISDKGELELLSKIYEENISFPSSSPPFAEHEKQGAASLLFYGFDLERIPFAPMTYYAPSLDKRGLIILNSVLVPDQNNRAQGLYAPNLGSEQLLVNLPRHFLLPGQNNLTLMSWKTEASRTTNRQYMGPQDEIEKAHQQQVLIRTWLPSIVTALSLSLISLSIFGLFFLESKRIYVGVIFANLSLAICSLGSGHSALSGLIRDIQVLRMVIPCLLLLSLIQIGLSLRKENRTISIFSLGVFCFGITGPVLILLSTFAGMSLFDEVFLSNLFLVSSLPFLLHLTTSRMSRDLADYSFTLSSLRRTIDEQAIILDEKSRIIAEEMQRRAVFEERQRMMRDIHDGIGGQLLSLLLRVRTGSIENKEVATDIQASLNDLRLVVDSIDHIDTDISSAMATFRSRAEKQMKAAGIQMTWSQSDLLNNLNLSSVQTLNLYRFMQEALSNIIRHAKTKSAKVSIKMENDTSPIKIEISDEGIGFSNLTNEPVGKGLKNLEIRAKKIGGTYNIGPQLNGKGTRITLLIPSPKEE